MNRTTSQSVPPLWIVGLDKCYWRVRTNVGQSAFPGKHRGFVAGVVKRAKPCREFDSPSADRIVLILQQIGNVEIYRENAHLTPWAFIEL